MIYVTSQTTTNPNDGSARTASTDILHRYLLHRLYPAHFKFEDAAEAIDGRGIFIPSGWDSSALIQDMEIDDGLDLLQFGKPPIATTAATGEKDEATIEATAKSAVTAYSEQSFLERLMKKSQPRTSLSVQRCTMSLCGGQVHVTYWKLKYHTCTAGLPSA